MTDYRDRVQLEKAELDDKRERLAKFFATYTFIRLDGAEQGRLAKQYKHMTKYSKVLGQRIRAFDD